jgi:protein-tyrosine-phosphatase
MKNAVKRLLPEPVKRELRRCRSYKSAELALYLKLRFLHATGVVNPRLNRPANTARSFVFVCYGNIMRSPMCEALMNRACADLADAGISITSAGLHAVPGTPAHPCAVTAARDYGISLEQHQSRSLTDEMIERADVLFAMDYQNHVQLISRWPGAKQKVYLLSAYADEHYKSAEIHDPYSLGEQATRDCYRVLDACIRNLRSTLS